MILQDNIRILMGHIFHVHLSSRDLQTYSVPIFANEFWLLRGVIWQSRTGLIHQ